MKPATHKAFQALDELVRKKKLMLAASTDKPVPASPASSDGLSDHELFQRAMSDVLPLGWSNNPLPTSLPAETQNPQGKEEGLRLLAEFANRLGTVDMVASGEYIEGATHARGHLLLEYLRAGHFAVQAHLDLHGLTVSQARHTLETFLRRSLHLDYGCVRIVHGRGRHSCDGHAVLKTQLQKWLSSRRIARYVVAYTSARMCDGGGGALYVLLRKSVR
jgi:DNA-nicking Smr family endonuclease